MPGRQAHGQPLTAAPKAQISGKKASKARSQKNALNAFGIAEDNFPTRARKTPRARELDVEVERKHAREDEAEDGEDEDEPPRKRRTRSPAVGHEQGEDDSDSEGNEWRMGGLREDDEDSEIDSDDAFGDSDNERFQEYSFRGSKSKQNDENDDNDDDEQDDSNDDEGETLGPDAIDLAAALDQWEEESDEEPAADESSESDVSEDDDGDSGDVDEESDDDDSLNNFLEGDEDDDEQADAGKVNALHSLISQYGGNGEEQVGNATKSRAAQKLSLEDLGLSSIKDSLLKKSVKLMNKEAREKRPGAAQKLEVPLSRREQGRLDRSAAAEKTNETLERWTETVKQNRRAEHLVFPLPQNSAKAGLNTAEIQPLATSNNELESTIMSIMEESGLSLKKEPKPKPKEYDEEGNELTRREALARKRRERELNSREAKRAKRIKKIKSKAFHRVHRKERERDEMANKEATAEAVEIDSEEEKEAQDRRRALERVGQRHKDSKWAKLGSKNKRAVWDDEFRTGLTEMARKDEELWRRKEGKTAAANSDDETSSGGSDSDGEGHNSAASLRRKLKQLEEEEDDEPHSKLMQMKFMQKAEAAQKQANDDMIRQIHRHLDEGVDENDTDAPAQDSSHSAHEEIGRRSYGTAAAAAAASPKYTKPSSPKPRPLSTPSQTSKPPSTDRTWSTAQARPRNKKTTTTLDLDHTASILPTASDSDAESPTQPPSQGLMARAFADDDLVASEFALEKADIAAADDDQVLDNTLPGWGSWVGQGVSEREQRRHRGRFLTKVEGVKKKEHRRDAKLDRVIISEKRIKKNDRYLAPQLPHVFESRQQYERSLRLPLGPEWMTKETFQDSTKPRVLMKQGIIAPISKPTA